MELGIGERAEAEATSLLRQQAKLETEERALESMQNELNAQIENAVEQASGGKVGRTFSKPVDADVSSATNTKDPPCTYTYEVCGLHNQGSCTGPAAWPVMCGGHFQDCAGLLQSPIDLDIARLESREFSPQATPLLAKYESTQARVKNNGVGLEVSGDFGDMWCESRNKDGVNEKKKYQAKEIHFHSPSSHTKRGQRFPLEMQIWHQEEGTTGASGMVVVSVMYDTGDAHAMAKWKASRDDVSLKDFNENGSLMKSPVILEDVAEEGKKTVNDNYNESALLKEILGDDGLPLVNQFKDRKGVDLNLIGGFAGPYIRYEGSMPFPPCTEGVKWLILEKVERATAHQLNKFANLLKDFGAIGNNRDVQPTGGRPVELMNVSKFYDSLWLQREENSLQEAALKEEEVPSEVVETEPIITATYGGVAENEKVDLTADQREKFDKGAEAKKRAETEGIVPELVGEEHSVIPEEISESKPNESDDEKLVKTELSRAERLVGDTEKLIEE